MDLQSNLIESKKTQKRTGGWRASLASLVLHGAILGGIIYMGTQVTEKVNAEEPIRAFVTQGAAPPPPPPAASSAPKATPKIQPKIQPKPVVVPQFHQPTEIPKEVPKVETPVVTTAKVDDAPAQDAGASAPTGAVEGGVAGGVVGGVTGGVVGGTVGGEVGGEIGGVVGGVKGGVVGGELGGKLGGTGTGTEGEGTGGKEAPVAPPAPPPPPPAGPMRVGGDVKAPTAVNRVQPNYTDVARNAKVSGVVIVEAVIDRNGNVDQVKVIKGLPMGLSEEAEKAVRKWKFRPGTLNGQPVDVIFNLTVNFQLGNA